MASVLDMREITDAFFFTKSANWAHEQEIRVIRQVATGSTLPGVVSFPTDLVTEIIIGARTSEENLLRAFGLRDSKYPKAQMKVALLDLHTYSMRIESAPPKLFMQIVRHHE